MVHILSDVLKKCHAALKPGGLLYSSQPGEELTHLTIHAGGQIAHEVDLHEAYFSYFLALCREALWNAVEEGLFVVEDEARWRSQTDFPSAKAWVDDRLNETDDDAEMRAAARDIDERFPDGVEKIEQRRVNWCLLLRKM